jgi:hypothetical protein
MITATCFSLIWHFAQTNSEFVFSLHVIEFGRSVAPRQLVLTSLHVWGVWLIIDELKYVGELFRVPTVPDISEA